MTAVFSNEIFRATSATVSFSAPVSSVASGSMRTSTSGADLLGNLGWCLHWHRAAALLGHRLALLHRLLHGLVLARLLGDSLARGLSWGRVAVAPSCLSLSIPRLGI